MVRTLHIAVCGAGPGGLASALALSRLGHRVTVFEQFESARPVGSGLVLQPSGLAVLDWLGVGSRIRTLGARLDRLHGRASGSGRVVLDIRYSAERGYAVHRAALFRVLHEAVVSAAIAIHTSSEIKGLDRTTLILNQGRREGPFDLVIDCLGARSPLIGLAAAPDINRALAYGAIWASLAWPEQGFNSQALEQRYHRASVMAGVLPIGSQVEGSAAQAAFFWSLKVRDFEKWRSRGLAAWKADVILHWPETASLLQQVRDMEQMVLARYHHHTLPLPFGERLAFVGDSAHSTSPQLGQGANMALLDVAALVKAFRTHADLQDALVAYAQLRRFHVRLYQALSFVFTPFYQSDSVVLPLIRDSLVSDISRIPVIARLLERVVSGQFGLKDLLPGRP